MEAADEMLRELFDGEDRAVLRLKVSKLKVSELKVCETKGILRLKVAIDDQIWSPLQL